MLKERHCMAFEHACLDMWQLQNLDFVAGFSCPHGGDFLTADGMALGNHVYKCCVALPCTALDSQPLQHGSVFADRTFVRDRSARELLRRFSSSSCADSGLLAADLDHLRQLLSDPAKPAHSLLPFLVSPGVQRPARRPAAPAAAEVPGVRQLCGCRAANGGA